MEIVRYIFDDLSVIPDPELFEIRAGVIGQRGLLVPETGVIRPQSSFQSLLDFWVGTVELSYMLGDAPGKVESTLEIMHERNWEAIIATSQTSAEAVITFEETSSTSITPQIYQEYIQPELKAWANLLHQKGKLLIHHAGGPIEDLLPKIAHSGIDVLESVSFRPYSGISMPQMRHALPSSITLMGGLDAATVGRMSETELEQYTKQLLMEMPKAGFILSSEVTGPPEAACSKQKLLAKVAARTGGKGTP